MQQSPRLRCWLSKVVVIPSILKKNCQLPPVQTAKLGWKPFHRQTVEDLKQPGQRNNAGTEMIINCSQCHACLSPWPPWSGRERNSRCVSNTSSMSQFCWSWTSYWVILHLVLYAPMWQRGEIRNNHVGRGGNTPPFPRKVLCQYDDVL